MNDANSIVFQEPRKLTAQNDPLHIIKTRKSTHGRPATIAGPMVRYSKLPFRALCREYNVDIVYTPMMLAREFVRSKHARMTDFTTNSTDTPLIVQVGVNNVTDLLKFVGMVAPYCDGIGINCGCPIKEQVREGIGCALIYNPELLCSMVKAVKAKYGDTLRLETKIRIHEDLDQTVALCERLCDSGVDWITIHGRTRKTRSSEPANLLAIKYVIDNIRYRGVPIVANGDCFTLKDLDRISEFTGADAVMAVRGLLSNPALFAGYDKCPWGCLEKFVYLATEFNTLPYQLTQHHIFCMLESMQVKRKLVKAMMNIHNLPHLIDWLETFFYFKRHGEPGFAEAIAVPYRPAL